MANRVKSLRLVQVLLTILAQSLPQLGPKHTIEWVFGRKTGDKMLRNALAVTGMVVVGLSLSGCNRSLNTIAPTQPPQALPSTPTGEVNANELPPIGSEQQVASNNTEPLANTQQTPAAPTTPDNPQVAALDTTNTQQSSNVSVSREGMAGSWQVPTDGSECRIILAFTKWSGGYRAATRRCNSPEIQSVTAWDVKDQSVVLVDQNGSEVARLFGASESQYNGRTKSGGAVSFKR